MNDTDKHGTLINLTSVDQEIPCSGAACHNVSKGGFRKLATTLILEPAEKNINVNNSAPGMVLTSTNQSSLDDLEALKKQVRSIPIKRGAQPKEIAHVAELFSYQANFGVPIKR